MLRHKLALRRMLRERATTSGDAIELRAVRKALRNPAVFEEFADDVLVAFDEFAAFSGGVIDTLLDWLRDNWDDVLRVLLMIVMLILGDEGG